MGLESGRDKYHLDRSVFGDRPENQIVDNNELHEIDGHGIQMPVDHGEQIEMFDKNVDLGVAPTERSEFTPPPTPESNGSWSNYGENVTDLRKVRGEEIPQTDSEQLDLPGIFEQQNSNTKENIKPEIDLTATPEEMAAYRERTGSPLNEKARDGLNSVGEGLKQRFESVKGFLNKNNLDTFNGLTEHGKRIAVEVFSRVSEFTGNDRIIAEINILNHRDDANAYKRKLDKITAKSNKEISALQTEITVAQKNREISNGVLAAMSKLSPEHVALFQAEIDRQDSQIAAFSNGLAAATLRQAESIKKQQEKIANSENAALEIGAKYISKVEARMAPINKLESAAINSLNAFNESCNEQEKKLQVREKSIAESKEKIRNMQKLRSSSSISDTETLRVIDKAIAENTHAVEHATELIEQTRLHAEHHRRILEKRVAIQARRKEPYEQKMAFFKNHKDTIEKQRSTTPSAESKINTSPEAASIKTENPRVSDVEFTEGFYSQTESSEVSKTVSETLGEWNEFIQSSEVSDLLNNKDYREFLTIDIESFVRESNGQISSVNTYVDPKTMKKYLAGKIDRILRSKTRLDQTAREKLIVNIGERFNNYTESLSS